MIDAIISYLMFIWNELLIALPIVVDNLLWIFVGVIAGMALGVIPGMGGIVVITIMVPFSLVLDPYPAFAMLSGALGATTFSGAITAILINTPGTGANTATLIDGYPLTRRGKAGLAIVVSAISSASGAILAVAIFILSIPFIIQFALLFGPSEIFWMVLFTIILIPLIVSKRNTLFALLTSGFGLLAAFVGYSPQTVEPRFTYGIALFEHGLSLVAVIIGLFAIAEILRLISVGQDSVVDSGEIDVGGSKMEGLRTFLQHKWLWFKCSIIGTVVGAMPGAGSGPAAFISYAHAGQTYPARNEEGIAFGEGRIEGVLAPESANDAKDGGQLFPTLGLGIPGSGTMAVFLMALMFHGIQPGPQFIAQNVSLVMVISIAVLISNISTSVIGVILAKPLTKLLMIPLPALFVAIAVMALTAVFIVRNEIIDVYVALFFGLVGLVFIYYNISRIPMIVAFILGGILETNFFLASRYAFGNWVEAFFMGTINQILILIFVLSLIFWARANLKINLPDDNLLNNLLNR